MREESDADVFVLRYFALLPAGLSFELEFTLLLIQ